MQNSSNNFQVLQQRLTCTFTIVKNLVLEVDVRTRGF